MNLNFVGDSIIGRDVNIEAGAILANHFNDRTGIPHDKLLIPADGETINLGK